MTSALICEVCVESVEAAVAAEQGGAHRVELCADLLEGGITPSAGTIALARARLGIRLHVLIRPRGGDFCYSDTELDIMRHDIATARALGADGVVLGVLLPDGTVDAARTAELMAAARPLSVTFHRAFDVTRDPYEALEALIALGVDRVLTSGQESSALEGLDTLAALVQQAGDRIAVMPGGGIRAAQRGEDCGGNLGAGDPFHRRARRWTVEWNTAIHACSWAARWRPPEYTVNTTDAEKVRAVIVASTGGQTGNA